MGRFTKALGAVIELVVERAVAAMRSGSKQRHPVRHEPATRALEATAR